MALFFLLKYHLLMLFPQQIIHRLYRIERTQRNFHKHRIPIAHGTVPQTGKFKCFKILAILRFIRDETGSFIYEINKIKLMTLIIAHSTNQIYRIKVRTLSNISFFSGSSISI